MDTQPALSFMELLGHIVGDMAKAVSERRGETPRQHAVRSQAAPLMIMSFLPRDVMETMAAGHCVMLHEVMVDSIRELFRGEADTARRSTRAGIVALDAAFGANLTRLERYQSRRSDGQIAEESPEGHRPEGHRPGGHRPEGHRPEGHRPEGLRPGGHRPEGHRDSSEARAPQTKAEAPPRPASMPLAPQPTAQKASSMEAAGVEAGVRHPSAEKIAECLANPEAMAALDAGDPERFARAMGVDMPVEAYIAAAKAQMPGLNRRNAAPAISRDGDR